MVCRVSVKFSMGSRSVTSKTTCENLRARICKDGANIADDRWFAEKFARKIERDLQIGTAAKGRTDFDADITHQVAGKVVDEIARLHKRNERTGQHQRPIRLAPAHQHFSAAQLA